MGRSFCSRLLATLLGFFCSAARQAGWLLDLVTTKKSIIVHSNIATLAKLTANRSLICEIQ